MATHRDLPPPRVAPSLYTEDYYRHHCGSFETWNVHEGREIDGYYVGVLREKVRLAPGERLADLGAGRGELVALAAHAGAARAVGVEYSESAVALSAKTLAAQAVQDRAEVRHGDVRATGLDAGGWDVVTLLDVVEHLTPAEVRDTLVEAARLLVPGGRVVIHTLPNRLVYDVTYRLQRLLRPSRRRDWPRQPRSELELQMHVNEFTLRGLRRALQEVGFANVDVHRGNWVLDHHIPDERARSLPHRLAAHRLTAPLGSADLWAVATRD